MGKLNYYYGAMNSGKTIELLKRAYNYEEIGKNVMVIKPAIDTKGDDEVVSRIGISRKVDQLIGVDDSLYDLNLEGIDVILADESNFFTEEQVNELYQIAVLADIDVLAYGLRTDFRAEGFPGSTRMLELAHNVIKLQTMCKCGDEACHNLRKENNVPVFDGDQVAIDGEYEVTYESLCSKCYLELRETDLNNNKNAKKLVLRATNKK